MLLLLLLLRLRLLRLRLWLRRRGLLRLCDARAGSHRRIEEGVSLDAPVGMRV
jgi:hypothetical protein